MIVLNIGFTNSLGESDETQLDIQPSNLASEEIKELINLILSLREELDIYEIDYIEYVDEEE